MMKSMPMATRFVLVAIFLAILLSGRSAYAQFEDRTSITLPSPNNVFSTPYLNADINLYTGTPGVSLPLYKLEAGDLNVPISLTYKGGGVKLQDIASFVGMSWNLNAGGSVTRVIRGIPDESEKGYSGKNKTGVEINSGIENDNTRANRIAKGELDGEPDLFYISTPTMQLSFVLDENGTPVFNEPTRAQVKMERMNGADDNINIRWTLRDEKGTKYTFGDIAAARELVTGTPEAVSTWYLTSMESFNGTEKINFEYQEGADIVTKTFNRVQMRFFTSGGCSAVYDNYTVDRENARTYKAPKYISAITSGIAKIRFIYGTGRKDLPTALLLRELEMSSVKDQTVLKRMVFKYGYFDAVETNEDRNRLSLNSIYDVSADRTNSMRLYNFSYYVDPALRFPLRNSVAFDHWGFYNNNSESTPFAPEANKQPDFAKTRQYSLKSVEHATGGKTEFEYELNNYYDNVEQTEKICGGLRIKSIKESDNLGNTYTRTYEYRLPDGRSSGQPFVRAFQYVKNTSIRIPMPPIGACFIRGESINSGVLFNLADVNGALTGYSSVKVINNDGSYEISKFTNFSDHPDVFNIVNQETGVTLNIENVRQFGFPTSVSYKRGLITNKSSYTNTGKIVGESIYNYGGLLPVERKVRGISLTMIATVTGIDETYWLQNTYYQQREAYRLLSQSERIYDQNSTTLYLEKTKTYEYSTDAALLRKTTYNTSEGGNITEKYFYPENRGEIIGLSANEQEALTQLDGLVLPVRQESNLSANNTSVSHTVYSYNAAAKKVYPVKQLSGRNGTFSEDVVTEADVTTGKLMSEQKKDGLISGYIWDINNKLIAKASQAKGNEIYYESFENLANATIGKAFTGIKYFSGNFSIPFVRPNSKLYKLSYRRLVNNVWQPVVKDYNTDNYTITESYPIDEIRIRPEGTRMYTYTYQSLVGINSACDENEVVQYFEYDNLNRLKTIRDFNGNVLKYVDYQHACNCPLPVLHVTLEYRNVEVIENPDFYGEYAQLYLVIRDQNGNPVTDPNITINYTITRERNGITTTNNESQVMDSSEALIFAGNTHEQYFNNGVPTKFLNVTITLKPGSGYQLN